jgi:RHS repeat-associated protein
MNPPPAASLVAAVPEALFEKNTCCAKRAYWRVNRPLPAKSRTTNLGPFGELLRATGPMAKANPFRFSTKYQDDETDLPYYGYWYYNAGTGRWLSRDPYGEIGFAPGTKSAPKLNDWNLYVHLLLPAGQ